MERSESSNSGGRISASVWFPRPREVEIRPETLVQVGPHEVRVRAIASALSHGTEMLVYRGEVPPELELDLPTLRGDFGFPIKYGYASVGRVVEIGAAVTDQRIDDLVFVHHPHQTEYVVPASMLVRLPDGVGVEAGLFIANLETAVNAMLDAGPRLGERVLILGQGVVGLLLTQLARRVGASLVVAADPWPARREQSEKAGAHVTLAPDNHLPEIVRELTGGDGVDVVLEASGSPIALGQAVECAAFQATVVVVSWYGVKPTTVPLGGAFHRQRLRIVSSQVSSLDPALRSRWNRARRMALALDLLPSLRLAPLITHRIPFDRAPEAYALVDLHPEQTVQVILTYGERG